MQITPTILANTLLQNVQTQESQIGQLQNEIATGQKFQVPSDNPMAAQETLTLNNALSNVNAFAASAKNAQGWLNQTSGALTSMIHLWNQVMQTAVTAANGTQNANDLTDLAQTIRSAQINLGQLLNTQYNNTYLFGGYQGSGAPVPSGNPTSLASWPAALGQSQSFQIDTQSQVTVNLTGYEDVGQAGGSSTNYFQQAYNDLGTLTTAIQQGPLATQQMLASLKSDLSNLVSAQALVGGRASRVQNTLNQLNSAQTDLSQSVANTSSANMAQVTTQLAEAEQSYQAALKSGAQVLPLSLLNFINP